MKKRILLLDDEIDFANVMKMTLELTGQYEVRTAVRSATFLTVAQDYRPDLILLDCMMPGLDGGEVAAALQADPVLKDTPFMFFTATADQPEQRESRCYAGVQTFLPKTMELTDLMRFIDAKLGAAKPPAADASRPEPGESSDGTSDAPAPEGRQNLAHGASRG
jgi:two-component system, OmpR family, response regulator